MKVNHLKKTKPVGISLPKDMLDRIDKRRGQIPRSTYIASLLQRILGVPEHEME